MPPCSISSGNHAPSDRAAGMPSRRCLGSAVQPALVRVARVAGDPAVVNFAPRLGIAYRLGPKTVIRTGAGIFYENWATWVQLGQSYGAAWPSVNLLQATNQNPNLVEVRASNPLSAIGAGALPAPTPFTQLQTFKDPFMKVPYAEEWNFGIQQQIGSSTTVSVDYVGSHGSRLIFQCVR